MLSFSEIAALPDEVMEDMLQAEGAIVKDAQVKEARRMLQGPYYADVVAQAAHAGKAKRTRDGGELYVGFRGKRGKTRVAEIAFVNEYGKRGQSARPFIRTANAKCEAEAVQAGEEVYKKWLESKRF